VAERARLASPHHERNECVQGIAPSSPVHLRLSARATVTPITAATLAYLDPGSASIILQMIAGGLAALAVTVKLFWRRILRFLRIKRDVEARAPSEPDSR
jgi:hypothetical protein